MIDILNLLSEKWLESMWRVTWQGGIFIGVIFLVTRIFRRLSPTIKHLLWMLVIVKFLIMPFVTVPIALPAFPTIVHEPPVKPVIETPVVTQESEVISELSPALSSDELPLAINVSRSEVTFQLPSVLFSIWLCGIIILLLGITFRSIRLKKDISKAKVLEDKNVFNIAAEGVNEFRIRPPTLKISDKFKSPLACGIVRPVIIFPEHIIEKFTESELRAIIYHELAHIKRKDILTNWFQILTQILYFFNPLVWYANRQIRIEREQACDDWVLEGGKEERKSYADALLKVVEICSVRERFTLGIVGVSETFTLMARRVKMIMDSGRKINTRLSVKVMIGLVIVSVVTMPSCIEKKSSDVQEKQDQLASVDEERILEIARSHLAREMPDLKQSQLEKSSINFALEHEPKLIEVRFRILSDAKTEEIEGGTRTFYPTWVVSMDFTGKLIDNIQKGGEEVEIYTQGKIKMEKLTKIIDKKPQSQSLPPQVSSKGIFSAVAGRDMVRLRKLLNDNPNLITAKDNQGYTLLHQAALLNQKEMTEFLLYKGADINAKDSMGRTPLHWAACNKEVAEFLLIKNADVNAEDNEGNTPLHLAAGSGCMDAGRTLLTKSVNINAKNKIEYTPLYLAIKGNRKEVVELLLSRGADINTRIENGRTLLHEAAVSGYKEIAELLLAKDTDINAKDRDNLTPLYWAVNQGHEEVAVLLINKGADVNPRDEFGWTPLHFASEKGHKRIIELLLSKDVNVNARSTGTGETPLHLASKGGQIGIADLLLSKGADVNARDAEGKSPLRAATLSGKKEVAGLLREHGGEE